MIRYKLHQEIMKENSKRKKARAQQNIADGYMELGPNDPK
jgi:hypothetical protein